MKNIILPKRIFCTGVPGSRWSGITQRLYKHPLFNKTDVNLKRSYDRINQLGELEKNFHTGTYFEHNTSLPVSLETLLLDLSYSTPDDGTMLHRSHQYAYMLDDIKQKYPDDWIWLIYRPDLASYAWWGECGGFKISYPDYSYYKDAQTMFGEITKQNAAMLTWAHKHNLPWYPLTKHWEQQHFGYLKQPAKEYSDILCCLYKPSYNREG